MTTAVLPEDYDIAPRSARAKCESQVRQMEESRAAKMERFRDLEAFISPYASNVDQTAKRHDSDALNVLDETVFYARTTLQSFLHSGMTNPSREWSQWALPDPDLADSESAKEWLHTVNSRRGTILQRSNFYAAMAWAYGEWPTFGTAVVLIEEDEADVMRYVPFGTGSYALADDAKGECIALSRRIRMTVRQIVTRFARRSNGTVDLTVLSKHIKDLIRDRKYEAQVEVCHLICPNDDYNPSRETPEHFAFSSYYWEAANAPADDDDGFLAQEGYREWPAMVFRWARIADDAWGTDAPGILTLAAVKALQQMESDKLMAIEKQVRPPLVIPTELTVASLLPAARNVVNTRTGQTIGALHETDANAITIIGQSQQEVRERIFSLWHTRMILAVTNNPYSNSQKTAREIEEISQERLLVLGRMVESAAGTFKRGADRDFAIMSRAGMLPPAPPDIAGAALAIEFTSMLAVAQKSIGLGALLDYGMSQAQMFKLTGAPEILLRTDFSQWAQEVGQRSGIPPKVQRTDEQVAEILAAQQEAAAAEAQAMQAQSEAKAMKDLSQADTTGDNALTRVMGGAPADQGAF